MVVALGGISTVRFVATPLNLSWFRYRMFRFERCFGLFSSLWVCVTSLTFIPDAPRKYLWRSLFSMVGRTRLDCRTFMTVSRRGTGEKASRPRMFLSRSLAAACMEAHSRILFKFMCKAGIEVFRKVGERFFKKMCFRSCARLIGRSV